jgi:hypothetical protein
MHSDVVEELLANSYRALKTLGNAQTVLETILAMIKEQWAMGTCPMVFEFTFLCSPPNVFIG